MDREYDDGRDGIGREWKLATPEERAAARRALKNMDRSDISQIIGDAKWMIEQKELARYHTAGLFLREIGNYVKKGNLTPEDKKRLLETYGGFSDTNGDFTKKVLEAKKIVNSYKE